MAQDYTTNNALKWAFDQIVPGSTESPVQFFMSNLLSKLYPIDAGYLQGTKHRQDGSSNEKDNVIFTIQSVAASQEVVEVYVNENKRLKENPQLKHFDAVAQSQLNRYLEDSPNAPDTRLFASVTIGQEIMFFKKMLPTGPVAALHPEPLHLWKEASTIIQWYESFKTETEKDRAWTTWTLSEVNCGYYRAQLQPDGSYLYDYDNY